MNAIHKLGLAIAGLASALTVAAALFVGGYTNGPAPAQATTPPSDNADASATTETAGPSDSPSTVYLRFPELTAAPHSGRSGHQPPNAGPTAPPPVTERPTPSGTPRGTPKPTRTPRPRPTGSFTDD